MNLFSNIFKKIITVALVIIILNSSTAPVLGAQLQPSDYNVLFAQVSQTLEAIRIKILAIAAALNEVTAEEAEPAPTRTTVSPPPPPPAYQSTPIASPVAPPPLPAPASTQTVTPTPIVRQPVQPRQTPTTVNTIDQIAAQITFLKARVLDLQKQLAGRTAPTSSVTQPAAPSPITLTQVNNQSRSIVPAPSGLQPKEPEFVKGNLIAQLKPGVSLGSPEFNDFKNNFGFQNAKELFPRPQHQQNPSLSNTYLINFSPSADVRGAVLALNQKPNLIIRAEPNFIAKTQQVPVQQVQIAPILPIPPNDPLYPQQWHLAKVKAEDAWGIERGNPNTVIAVIDTGVRWNHPDLAANIWINSGEIPNNNLDDDNNGYIDDVRGWDFVETIFPCWPGEDCNTEDNNPNDFHGHGTHVAGIAGAVTNNGIGVAGACWFCKLMAVRAGFAYQPSPTAPGPFGALEYDDIAQALTYAADNGADIISMSFGGYDDSQTMENAVNYAYSQGSMLIASAGNSAGDSLVFPGSYPNVLAVAATDQNDNAAGFTNFGAWVDIAAPGVDILSTAIPGLQWGCSDSSYPPANDGYGLCSGTSMAAPLMSGVMGLAISKIPSLNQDQRRTLAQSAYDAILSPQYLGNGRTNARKAVEPSSVPVSLLNNSLGSEFVSTGEILNIIGTATGQNFASYEVQFGGGAAYPTSFTTIWTGSTPINNGSLATWNPTNFNIAPGNYTIKLTVNDNQFIWEDRTLVVVDTTLVVGFPQQIGGNTGSGPALRDVDGDGDGELFFQSTNFETFPYLDRYHAINHDGSSLPNFPVSSDPNSGGASFDLSPAVDNIDGDNAREIIYGSRFSWGPNGGESRYYVYQSSGIVQPGWPIITGTNYTNTISGAAGSPVIANLTSASGKEIVLVTQDVSGICPSLENKIYVYQQNGQIAAGWPQILPGYPAGTPAVGDLDQNGDLEIVISTAFDGCSGSSNLLYVFNHNGTIFPGWPQNVGKFSPVLANIDQNDNGKLEIIQEASDGNLYVFNHDGTLVPGWPQPFYPISEFPAIGDIDNNGDLEIVFGSYLNGGVLYVVNHDGSVFSGWPITLPKPPWSVIVVDLDGNGIKEILATTLWPNNLYGFNFDGSQLPNFPKPIIAWPNYPVAGKFDGDNFIDVIITDREGNIYRYEFSAAPTNANLPWPMFHHDPQHTGKYP